MKILHDAMTAWLSGLTTKTGNEIHWVDRFNCPITVEVINPEEEETYIVRYYYENGKLDSEASFYKNMLHGLCRCYYKNGKLEGESNFCEGRPNGLWRWYNEDGQLDYEENYINGVKQ